MALRYRDATIRMPSWYRSAGLCRNQLCTSEMATSTSTAISEAQSWLRQTPAERYHEGIQALVSRWCEVTDLEGDSAEKLV
jgi:hypothetical protein